MACGNGLRPDVWSAFQERFRVPHILEFYAATEGNVSLVNVEGKPGAIGRVPPFLAHRFPATLVRYDADAEAPVRDARGRCVRCAPNEVGEAIGQLPEDQSNVGRRFEGYTNEEASEQKILRDVFEPGDAWFRTGDLMRRDEDGYFYFVDRIGDTFRWKGENVATAEVAEAICAVSRNQGGERLRRGHSRHRRPGRHGHHRRRRSTGSGRFPGPPRRPPARACAPAYSCASGDDLAVTATFKHTKERARARGLRPGRDLGRTLFRRS